MSTNQLISLLDFLAYKGGCMYLSDLRSINSTECRMLKRCIEEISAIDLSPENGRMPWNILQTPKRRKPIPIF